VGLSFAAFLVLTLILTPAENRSAAAQTIESNPNPALSLSTPPFTIGLELIANGLPQLTQVTHADDDSGRLFVVERAGRIRVITAGLVLTPFLDIHSLVESANFWERGLLSLAFDPDYKTNGTFYVDYTSSLPGHVGDIIVARYQVADPQANVATVLTVTPILTIVHPQTVHHGGQLQFGPNDDYLYVSVGEADLLSPAQDLTSLLGKILRLNVRGVPTYTIPSSNPFIQTANARKEIWAYGLRNPWRFSFDRSNGDLYLGDVGHECWEEIDYQPASSHGGENYGWPLMEGRHYFKFPINCNYPVVPDAQWLTLTRPITNYQHTGGSFAVMGGVVYRGAQCPWLTGMYLFNDFGTGRLWSEQRSSPNMWLSAHLLDSGLNLTSFGEDQDGEVYVADFNGAVYKIISTRTDLAPSIKFVSDPAPRFGARVTYTIGLRAQSDLITQTIVVTDEIPIGLSYLTGSFTATRGSVDETAAPILKWTGALTTPSMITLTYAVTISTVNTQTLINTAAIDAGPGLRLTRSAIIVANGWRAFLPILVKAF
jgi:uncharacterized repeat protein (TIGR01451 family)